jgi:hypothetical protein
MLQVTIRVEYGGEEYEQLSGGMSFRDALQEGA